MSRFVCEIKSNLIKAFKSLLQCESTFKIVEY